MAECQVLTRHKRVESVIYTFSFCFRHKAQSGSHILRKPVAQKEEEKEEYNALRNLITPAPQDTRHPHCSLAAKTLALES